MMSKFLFVVGIIIVVLSAVVGVYSLFQGSLVAAIQAFFSLCTGCVFILIRNLTRNLEQSQESVRKLSLQVYDLQYEFDKDKQAPHKQL